MQFSQAFRVANPERSEWFDPILNRDTELFIDPFLIFRETKSPWAGAHDRIVKHFEVAFRLVSESSSDRDLRYRKALAMLEFPEPQEFCLGYTGVGVAGAGSGPGRAELIVEAMENAIDRGLGDLRHFEELGILQKSIGRDLVSDTTCNILKEHFIKYTVAICRRLGIETRTHRVPNARFDYSALRWLPADVDLPTNPYNERPIILTPKKFLGHLHALNAVEWFEWYQDERYRDDVNYEIMTSVDKKTIVETARRNPEYVRRWVEKREGEPVAPYDLDKDRQLVWQWHPVTYQYAQEHPLRLRNPATVGEFMQQVEAIVDRYQRFMEDQGGWRLLWNDDKTEKDEDAAQLTFYGIAQPYCEANGVVVDREVNLGRGPVDFKFSNGYERRILLEVKKLTSGHFWDGLEEQLPSYMKSDACRNGWLLAMKLRDSGVSEVRARELPGEVRRVAKEKKLDLRYKLVDARPKASASTLRRKRN
jgi:hypothetical protein